MNQAKDGEQDLSTQGGDALTVPPKDLHQHEHIETVAEAPPIDHRPVPVAAQGTSSTLPNGDITRIEQLLEQQNQLMLRHITTAQEAQRRAGRRHLLGKTPHEIISMVHPGVRHVFKTWRRDFTSKVSTYIAHSHRLNQYQKIDDANQLIQPFQQEAQTTWHWPGCYLASAQCMGASPLASAGAEADEPLEAFDINLTFAQMRQRHAEECQAFIVSHQKACVQSIRHALSLSRQRELLKDEVSAWADVTLGSCRELDAREMLDSQASAFAELVYNSEMVKAENMIQNGFTHSSWTLWVVRVASSSAIMLPLLYINTERMTGLLAVLIALACGMSLVWEDQVRSSMHLLRSALPQLPEISEARCTFQSAAWSWWDAMMSAKRFVRS